MDHRAVDTGVHRHFTAASAGWSAHDDVAVTVAIDITRAVDGHTRRRCRISGNRMEQSSVDS